MKIKHTFITYLFIASAHYISGGNNKYLDSQLPESLFEKNRGQFLSSDGKPAYNVLYRSKNNGLETYLTRSGLSYVYREFEYDTLNNDPYSLIPGKKEEKEKDDDENFLKVKGEYTYRVNLVLENINKDILITESDKDLFYTNYYTAEHPEGITHVPHFRKVQYQEVWKNIDWSVKNSDNGLKHEFILNEGADIKQVRFKIEGAKKTEIKNGRLIIHTPYGTIEENDLYCYVEQDGQQQKIDARYLISENGSIGFDIDWNGKGTLVIDPSVLWSTYHVSRGGSGGDGGCQMTTDRIGNVFVSGGSYITSGFPVLNPFGGAYFQGGVAGTVDVFILKFSPGGVKQWATFYGGTADDYSCSVKADNIGNILVAGSTLSNNFPTQNPYDATANGGNDAILISFTNNGIRNWATYLGGSASDIAISVTSDVQGNVYSTGFTNSVNFPMINPGGAYMQAFGGGGNTDAFVVKLSKAGNALWSTYFGGNQNDVGNAITTDKFGNVFVTGSTDGNMPLMNPGGGAFFDNTFNGGNSWQIADAFIIKFNSTLNLTWSTYYGGNGASGMGGTDEGYSVVTDQCGNLFVLGYTESSNIPTYNPGGGAYYDNIQNNGSAAYIYPDLFILKFNPAGILMWATYYGGSDSDYNNTWDADNSLAIDKEGKIYITFGTYSQNIPIINPSSPYSCPPATCTACQLERGHIAVFNNNGAGLWSTYIDPSTTNINSEQPNSISVDGTGNIVAMIGSESTGGFQLVNPGGGAYIQPHTASVNREMYFIKFTPVTPNTIPLAAFTASPKKTCAPLSANFSNSSTGYDNYTWNFGDGGTATTYNASHLYNTPGTYVVTLILEKISTCIKDTLRDTVKVLSCNINGIPKKMNICTGNCPVITASTSGTAPYTYSWNTGAATQSINPCPTANTTYFVKVTDASGTTHTDTTYVTISPVLNIITSATYPSCSGINNGSASVTVNNGTSPYSYNWSSGQISSSVYNLAPGTYTVTATDANGCTGTKTVTITTYPPFTVSIATTPNTCPPGGSLGTGTATPTTTGGTGTYAYSWLPPVNSFSRLNPNQTQLNSGVFTVNVTDGGSGCSQTATVTVAQGAFPTATFTISPGKVVCVGTNVTFTNTGTMTGGSWQVSGPASGSGTTTNFSFTFNIPGTYVIWHQGTQGSCNLFEDDTLVVVNCTSGVPSPATFGGGCANSGDCSKKITANATGGTTPYTYSWSTGATTDAIFPCATSDATYTVTVKDATGVTNTTTAAIIISPVASFTQTPAGTVCIGTPVNFTGITTAGATYNWNIGAPANVSGTTANFSASFLYEGTYTVTHTVARGSCGNTTTSTVKVINCTGITINVSANSVCSGSCTSVTSGISGGTTPYTYSWSNGATTQNISTCLVSNTTYSLTITDAGGTTASTTVVVNINPAVTANTTPTNITCAGGTGSALAAAGGGTAPYNYNWNNGQNNSTATGLFAGNYTVTITDSKGCTSASIVSITSPAPLIGQFVKGNAACAGCGCKEWLVVNATGGTSPYSYSWPDGYTNRYKNQLCPGSYTIKVVDKNGCSSNLIVNAP